MPLGGPHSDRVLIFAARRRDDEVASRHLADTCIQVRVCNDAAHLEREMRDGAGCAAITHWRH